MAWYLDQDLCALRIADVLQAAAATRLLFKTKTLALEVRGHSTIWALCAAALDPAISATTCHRGLISYAALTRTDRHLIPASHFLRGILKHTDLPRIAALIAPRRLTLTAPVDAMLQPVPLPEAMAEYQPTRDAYRRARASNHFVIS